jgi:hypothetical protein
MTPMTPDHTAETAIDPVTGCRTLMVRMGTATGADLMDALAQGRMGALELRDVLAECSACTCKKSCESWLDAHLGAQALAAPEFCRNRSTMDALAGRR